MSAQTVIRSLDRPGDLDWVVMAHGEIYAEQFGWDAGFEALVARIVADYARDDSPDRAAAWIAEHDGRRVGCVFCVPADDSTAQLRILLVDPSARGLGIGPGLVAECLRFAGRAGYHRITLWTNDVLVPRDGSTRRPASTSPTRNRTTASVTISSGRTGLANCRGSGQGRVPHAVGCERLRRARVDTRVDGGEIRRPTARR